MFWTFRLLQIVLFLSLLPIHPSLDIWVAHVFWLLRIMLLWAYIYNFKCLSKTLFFFGISRSGIVGSYCNSMFNFFEDHHTGFWSSCIILYSYQHCTWVPVSPHPFQHLFIFLSLIIFVITMLVGVKWCLIRFWCAFFPND